MDEHAIKSTVGSVHTSTAFSIGKISMSKNGVIHIIRTSPVSDQPSNAKPAVSFGLYRGALNDEVVAKLADRESDFWGDFMTDSAAVILVSAVVNGPRHGPEDLQEFWESVKSAVDAQLDEIASRMSEPRTS